MAGGRRDQPVVVGIAADHSMQHDDICRLDLLRRGCNVNKPPVHPIRQPKAFQQGGRLGLVVAGDFKVRGLASAAIKQLNLDLANSATDFEHRGVTNVMVGQKGHYAALGWIESTLAVGTGKPFGEPITEHRLVATAAATVAHGISVPPAGSPRRSQCGMITEVQASGGAMAENPIEQLAESACLELLRGHHFGRVAFIEQADGPPAIMPVNYLMRGEVVVFRTDPNSKLGQAVRSTTATFEIDGIDERERTGWSVVVSGRAEQVVDPTELDELRQTPLLPWAPGDRSQYVRITPELVTGRCISVAELPSNWWG